MSTCTESARRGQGAVLALVLVLVGLIAVIAGVASQQTWSTGRALVRVVDLRTVLETAESAMLEALVLVRASADGGPRDDACPDDWRKLLLDALDAPARPAPSRAVQPLQTRKHLTGPELTLAVGDVRVQLAGLPGTDCGVLEFSVRVDASRGPVAVHRTVRQRRAFTVECAGRRPVDRRAALITVHADPLGTVIE